MLLLPLIFIFIVGGLFLAVLGIYASLKIGRHNQDDFEPPPPPALFETPSNLETKSDGGDADDN